jgi:Txe/YoeB family toxin of Txe-Axe toxin-antitoxin module
MIQAIKVPTTIKVKTKDGKLVKIHNNDPFAGKTKFIKHKPTPNGKF